MWMTKYPKFAEAWKILGFSDVPVLLLQQIIPVKNVAGFCKAFQASIDSCFNLSCMPIMLICSGTYVQ
jgi:hypothetical protein